MEADQRGFLQGKPDINIPNDGTDKSEKFINNNNQNNQPDSEFKLNKFFLIRGFLVISGLSIVILNTVYGFVLPNTNVNCLDDKAFEITADINKYLQDNITPRHIIIAVSSFCEDFIIIYISLHWIFYGKSWRLIASLISFYFLRGCVQSIFQMKYPEGYLWEYPNFPSITISYLKTNDFFFSGHIGFPIIIALECNNLKKKFMMAFCLFTCVDVAFTMIVTRGHYCIDLVTGIIVSHYIYLLVEKYIFILDDSCIGMKGEDKKDGFIPVEIKENNSNIV
jgi:hypothetical protein